VPVRTRKQKQTNKYKLDILPTWNAGDFINEKDLIKDMSKHILEADPDAYDGYNKLTEEEKEKKAQIQHHAIATQQREKGDNVLSFIIAGSGNAQWNKVHKGFNGINEKFTSELIEENEKKEKKEVLDFVNQHYRTETNQDITENEDKLEEALREVYGESQYVDENGNVTSKKEGAKLLSGFREIKKGTQTTVNLSGPLGDIAIAPGMAGSFNTGDYSIENLEKYVVNYADKWLSEKANELKEKNTIKPIHIHLKGHSRGGVAANESAVLINKLIEDKYPALREYVDFDLAVYDPVPGLGSYSEHASVDHASDNIKTPNGVGKGLNSDPTQKNSVTVIYSLHSNNDWPHKLAFKPQEVKGANRVIMTGMNHDVGIYDIEDNHKASFIYSGNGEKYRGTGLSELPEGTFFLDENNVLTKAKSKTIAQKIADKAIGTCGLVSRFFQRGRTKIMASTIEDSFAKRPEISKHLKWNKAHNDRIDNMAGLGKDFGLINNKNALTVDVENMLKDRVASILALRVAENASKTRGKEMTEEQFLDTQGQYYVHCKENTQKLLEDPSFNQFFSSLTFNDLKELTTDFDGRKTDQMIKAYSKIVANDRSPADKGYQTAINMVDASKELDPGVYALLLKEGHASFKILSQFGLQQEKADAISKVNKLKETPEGKKALSELIAAVTEKYTERLDKLANLNKFNPNAYISDRTAYTLAEAKMLGKMSKELTTLGAGQDKQELIKKAGLTSRAFDCITEGIRSRLIVSDRKHKSNSKEIDTVMAYNKRVTELNKLCETDGKISDRLKEEDFIKLDKELEEIKARKVNPVSPEKKTGQIERLS